MTTRLKHLSVIVFVLVFMVANRARGQGPSCYIMFEFCSLLPTGPDSFAYNCAADDCPLVWQCAQSWGCTQGSCLPNLETGGMFGALFGCGSGS